MHGIKKFIFQSIALLIIISAAIYIYTSGNINLSNPFQKETRKQLQIGNSILKVEIADTDSKRIKGLGGKDSLATDEGMLFVYQSEGKYSYWMKGLNFPLDFIWINGEKVVDILTNAPPPAKGQKDETLTIYKPVSPVDKVLEVNYGVVDRLQIKVGDTVKLN